MCSWWGKEKFVFWELKDKFACVFGFVVVDGGLRREWEICTIIVI